MQQPPKETPLSEENMQLILDSTDKGIISIDATGKCTFANKSAQKMLGRTEDELLGKEIIKLMCQEKPDGQCLPLHESRISSLFLSGQGCTVDDEQMYRENGASFPVEYSSYPIKNSGNIEGAVITFSDISERKRAENRLYHLANYDDLTELPNRNLFMDRLHQAITRSKRGNKQMALVVIDLDQFKKINETLGHEAGDQVLQEVSLRLSDCLRKCDSIARLSSDIFAITLESIGKADDIHQIVKKLLENISKPFNLTRHEIYITSSAGISIYPTDGTELSILQRNAEAAMYKAKEEGRNSYQFYKTEMNEKSYQRMMLENSLRLALDKNEFLLHYQPQVDLSDGKIFGAEALLRWQHPKLGLVSPADFIPTLEETDLIIPVGEWVLKTACQQLKDWQSSGAFQNLRISVNLSSRQFARPGIVDTIRKVVQETGIKPHLLEIEITESTIMHNIQTTIDSLKAISAMGIRVAIDDFGIGYSSLAYLKRFPIDTLKIDRAFIRDLTIDSDDEAITSLIVAMARSLKLDVIAEGVETNNQLLFLKNTGCNYIQGFLFSKPLAESQFIKLLKGDRRLYVEAKEEGHQKKDFCPVF